VDCAVLFGSAATGRETPASDVDVYLRLAPGARWDLRERLELAAELSRLLRREIDLVVEDDRTSVILRRQVAISGRLVYESRPGAFTDLKAAAMIAYADLEPLLRRMRAAVLSRTERS
jgi:predicted nucleotidyltransferase